MLKVNNNNIIVRRDAMRKCRAIKLAFNKFKDAVTNIKKFNADDEALVRLVLENLLTEVRRATKAIEELGKKKEN